ncbi:phage tail sheath subtilisin-like domain-containing protein [Aneurinibacillus aneurinilyticus]|uniref:phage tail sheath subtilisin-like domain-containing protein n=1 Tax=Aneurinibacillus aneurinilyticus TaxID=1391 RepID=UPI0023F4D7E5|nr:phage tail sheath subtilisin-like domain-containing protein [Aneurinibacillus aneurinilyticus]
MGSGAEWDPISLPTIPGLYINFTNAAIAQITGGARGIVAIPLMTYANTATAKTFYTIENEKQAKDLFGLANIKSILFALQLGAKEVLVYTMPATPVAEDYIDMRDAFDTRPFNVFVYDGEVTADEQDATVAWVKRCRKEDGKHFIAVFGGSAADDQDPAIGNARTIQLRDKYTVNLISGAVINGVSYTSSQYAAAVAGLIAGTAINKSTTYAVLPIDDVTKRLTSSQIKTALQSGSFVLIHDGEKVKVQQGLTTDNGKIRKVRAEQAIATDITKTAADAYIGKIDNNEDGQKALIAAVKRYLEVLATNNVLRNDSEHPIIVMLDPERESIGDKVFLLIKVAEVDSMEYILLTIETK